MVRAQGSALRALLQAARWRLQGRPEPQAQRPRQVDARAMGLHRQGQAESLLAEESRRSTEVRCTQNIRCARITFHSHGPSQRPLPPLGLSAELPLEPLGVPSLYQKGTECLIGQPQHPLSPIGGPFVVSMALTVTESSLVRHAAPYGGESSPNMQHMK